MDELARHNQERWEELSREGVEYGRPWMDLTPGEARKRVDPEGMLAEISGRDVLLLAGGGGQQSAAFGLLGARVTVLDFSENQLDADRRAAAHYGLEPALVRGDMRDLSRFANSSFDVVWHAHSLAFIPDPRPIFREAARVLRPGGLYHLHCTNPFVHTFLGGNWAKGSYVPTQPYLDGREMSGDSNWDVCKEDGTKRQVEGPREFMHAMSTLVNEPIALGFKLLGAWEDFDKADPGAPPGTWAHFCAVTPPWLAFWWQLAG